jgi:hypothetical protein
LYFRMAPDSPRPEELPVVCRWLFFFFFNLRWSQ